MTSTNAAHERTLRFLGRMPRRLFSVKIAIVVAVVFVVLFGAFSNATPASAAPGDSCASGGAEDCDPGEVCVVNTLTCAVAAKVSPGSSDKDKQPTCGTFAFGCKLVAAVSHIVASAAYAINITISLIVGLIVSIETWVVGIVLKVNEGVMNALIVQKGFEITLALANLGFVLGIIIVALATILRSQTYGVKQILWKLVIAAILVNFGLSIAGVFISFANSLTTYFTDGFGGPVQFAVDITAVFQPQRYVKPEAVLDNPETLKLLIPISTGIGSVIAPITSVLLGVIGMLGVVITLATLIVLLLIRYVYLAFLLILMPLAWVSWVFPSLRSHWSKWWSTFLRWTFFPPLVVFFIWLVLQMGRAINAGSPGSPFAGIQIYSDKNNSVLQGIFFPVVQNTLNNVLIIALLMGGLFAANSLGIKFAGAGMKAFGAAKGAVLGYYGRQTKKGGRWAYQKSGAQKAVRSLQEGRLGKIGRIPIIGEAFRRGASLAGSAIEKKATNEKMVKEAQKGVPENWEDAKREMAGSRNAQGLFARIAKGVEEGKIKKTDRVNNMTADEFMSQKDLVDRYGQQKLRDDYNKHTGGDDNIRAANRAQKPLVQGSKDAGEQAYEAALKGTARQEAAAKLEAEAEKTRNRAYTSTKKGELDVGHAPDVAEQAAQKAGDEAKAEYLAKNQERIDGEARTIAESKRAEAEAAHLQKNDPKVKVVDTIKDENDNVVLGAGEEVAASKLAEEANKQFARKFTTENANDINAKEVFGKKAYEENPQATAKLLEALTKNAPRSIPTIMKNMDLSSLTMMMKKFPPMIDRLIAEQKLIVQGLESAAGTAAFNEEKLNEEKIRWNQFTKLRQGYNRTINNYFGTWEGKRKKGGKEDREDEDDEGGGSPDGTGEKT